MPGSIIIFGVTSDDESVANPEAGVMSAKQPPPVAPKATSVKFQTWQSANPEADSIYGDNGHARSASMDSLESSGSSTSSGGSGHMNQRMDSSATHEYIPTRFIGKTPKLPPNNPLQFVKVQSSLCVKAEQQIKLTKDVKICRETLKEGEEEWQSNLDNWKSRRRKVSEKVIQRAEEMRQIEAEEQLRKEQILQQQRKIKKFSEMVEKRSTARYNLELYIGPGDDSGLGGTPEPDDTIDGHMSLLRSDTSEGMTSEAESIDSDVLKSDKTCEKEPPKVPAKPQLRCQRETIEEEFDINQTSGGDNLCLPGIPSKDLSAFDNFSSTEPSDFEGHGGDSETISSEEDLSYLSEDLKSESNLKDLCDQNVDSDKSFENGNAKLSTSSEESAFASNSISPCDHSEVQPRESLSFSISIKPGDNRGFGFTIKGGKDQGHSAFVDSITKYGPAEISGLKEGDKIISLNGEFAIDHSHASLIFSIKQAVYTGNLDIVISRSTENSVLPNEVKVKSSNRKSSFAEKLALFSSGTSTKNTNGTKTPVNISKSDPTKPESLVLRRRSAFENGKKEDLSYRRLSCLTQNTVTSEVEKTEKRHSIDLSLTQYSHENGTSVKKGSPPPVPVKPKLKPKISSDFQIAESPKSFNSNETMEQIPSKESLCYVSSQANNENLSQNLVISEPSNENNLLSNKLVNDRPNMSSLYDTQYSEVVDEKSVSEDDVFSTPQNTSASDTVVLDCNSSEMRYGSNVTNIVIGNDVSVKDIEEYSSEPTFENISNENFTAEEDEIPIEPPSSDCFNLDMDPDEPSFDTNNISQLSSDIQFNRPDVHFDLTNNTVDVSKINEYENLELQTQTGIDSASSETFAQDVDLNVDDKNSCNGQSYIDNTISDTSVQEKKDINNDSEELDENISHINPSPLCLPLEKIDEDDVISASTTTSSETPDTETVIETLPLNLSPLPNDESNGEESFKLASIQEQQSETVMNECVDEPTEKLLENSKTENVSIFENVPIQEAYESRVPQVDSYDTRITPDNQDDEYCRELDESIDQITSLDVIDEIEQRLMHQLEQQDEIYDDNVESLTAQLEEDINKQWLYFTDDSEYYDDLTPRNLEPPREPPPPPPPPEPDMLEKLPPMSRTNSTKRIKKEIWRRRSDFLGLDSPEGIDIDNIPPPPPGLEEILKQEREQTQWLEKRLSLAETEASAHFYENELNYSDTQDYTQRDYCSEYFSEENDDIATVPANSSIEQWRENLSDQTIFESSEFAASHPSDETPKANESPQHKAKQALYTLGAAPKAKIMDSNKWITEKVASVSKTAMEPISHKIPYNQNYWLAQEDAIKKTVQPAANLVDRRYSMPPFSHPNADVTVRTWRDREFEYQKQRPRSAQWNFSENDGEAYEPYSHQSPKRDVSRTHSLDSRRDSNCDTDFLESEVHKCSSCGKGLCEGSAMGIEALRLYFHIECFRCCVCFIPLGNGSCGTDVQVKNNQLFCPNCFTVD